MDELSRLKKSTRSILGFFYSEAELSDSEVPRLLYSLPGRVRGYLKMALVKASSLTLGILKSRYPKASLDVVAEGWAAGTSLAEAEETTRSFKGVASKVAAMIETDPDLDAEL